ncbi:MAG: acetyl-CoA hydrolase/transferase family protein [Flavobacteriales bacterium]|nr:acetyl-CoA hydrolase/transferase family protein [Flavobacteriales bacterium]MBK6945650.1 acetyl-CoA hydrolase/transferase family protein [Flavobacteriales bacterium]MBK9534798.1 acetyl-CoA hydrolase/transferase family protein [Flavobacteriales bacterium]MBP9137730.1 acetyl-CoA hydrolase/transferase family protein [Flavobacteriales bacterium]HQV52035.1 acetyl-CoA hydrolase/transferase C-terminal domain-containing protein [Flavobacteriales bacterium]
MKRSGVWMSASEAVGLVRSGQRVFIHGSAATPVTLLRALFQRAGELKNVELVSISTLGDIGADVPVVGESFFFNSLFVSDNIRSIVNSAYGDYVPVFLSEIPRLFEQGVLPLDVAILNVSPPDRHGFCSLGVSVDVARSASRNAKMLIAQVNPNMPRTHGEGNIHVDRFAALVEVNDPLPEVDYSGSIGDCEKEIARNCAELIDNGSTLQMGIGAIPDAILNALKGHKDLGVHTEMCSNGIIELVESGVINNRFKKKHPGRVVTSFAIGTRRLYDLLHDNPQFAFLDAQYVNDGKVIRENPKVVAINSAIEMDMTGQVCADSIGTYQYSGVGGQLDFMRGAALSKEGKPIIAMGSVTKKGISKIVPFLKEGAGVVTTRAHMHYVVTEFGVAYLYGKNLRQRAEALIAVAHPDHREALERSVVERFGTRFR